MSERWLDMAQRLFPHLQKRDGLPEGELKAAEKRLGFPLPEALRTMYRTAGRRTDLHETWDRLVAPKNLIVVKEALVFYEEHDRTAAWAIRRGDIDQADPPVVMAPNAPPFVWSPDHDSLSAFFLTELLWTHVHCEPCALLETTPSTDGFDEIELPGCHWGIDGCYGHEGLVMMVRGGKTYVGATSPEALERVRPS